MDQDVQVSNVNQNSDTCDQIQEGGGTVRVASPLPSKSSNPAVSAAPNIVPEAHKQDLDNPDPTLIIKDVQNDTSNLVPEFHKCKVQIGTKFGCIPLTPMYKGESRVWDPIPDVITAHKLIKATGIPNFLGLCIPIITNLNVSNWRKYLDDYFDQQLPDLIEFGFPLDFDRSRDLQSTFVNHASACFYPDHVDRYINKEVGFQAMLGQLVL